MKLSSGCDENLYRKQMDNKLAQLFLSILNENKGFYENQV